MTSVQVMYAGGDCSCDIVLTVITMIEWLPILNTTRPKSSFCLWILVVCYHGNHYHVALSPPSNSTLCYSVFVAKQQTTTQDECNPFQPCNIVDNVCVVNTSSTEIHTVDVPYDVRKLERNSVPSTVSKQL